MLLRRPFVLPLQVHKRLEATTSPTLLVALEAVLLGEVAELPEAQAQQIGRVRLDTASLLERAFQVLALDFLYVNGMLVMLTLGIFFASGMYFVAALLIALFGFVSSAALAKFLLRGEVIE